MLLRRLRKRRTVAVVLARALVAESVHVTASLAARLMVTARNATSTVLSLSEQLPDSSAKPEGRVSDTV